MDMLSFRNPMIEELAENIVCGLIKGTEPYSLQKMAPPRLRQPIWKLSMAQRLPPEAMTQHRPIRQQPTRQRPERRRPQTPQRIPQRQRVLLRQLQNKSNIELIKPQQAGDERPAGALF